MKRTHKEMHVERYSGMKKIMMSTLLSGALTLGGGVAQAADIFLCAGAFNKTMDSDGVTIPMWGFSQVGTLTGLTAGCSTANPPTSPGPMLTNPGDATGLTIYLFNDGLPENISIVIPGQNATSTPMVPQYFLDGQGRSRVRAFTSETTPLGAIGVYAWTSLKPGSFIYQSGSHAALQVQMGLYGGLSQDFAGGVAYPGKNYNSLVSLFYSEIDPVLHAAVAAGCYGPETAKDLTCNGTTKPLWTSSTIAYNPRYFLLNGTDVPQHSTATAGVATLVRFYNAGYKSHVPLFNGLTMDMIAEDGNPYNNYTKKQYSVLLAAGQTADAIITPAAGVYSFFDRMLNLTNKTNALAGGVGILALTSTVTPQVPGSLVSQLLVAAAELDTDSDGVVDSLDNCTLVSNADQRDTNSDGFGNICDGDLNNDGMVDLADLSLFRSKIGGVDADADFNNDGAVNLSDYSLFRKMFGRAPGPAGVLVP